MNNKILPLVKEEGFCCLWAWCEANRAKLTSELRKELPGVTVRALQYQRAAHRAGETKCEGAAKCLRARIKAGHTIA